MKKNCTLYHIYTIYEIYEVYDIYEVFEEFDTHLYQLKNCRILTFLRKLPRTPNCLGIQLVRSGHQSPVRALQRLKQEIQQLSHSRFPGRDNHWERAELKKMLRELLWEMAEVDQDIWSTTVCDQVEFQRVQAREDHHYLLRKAGVLVARSALS